ncbi:MAG TPA: T9SS type A sorting domain-containing protein [Chitinophagales bacterium]|nr:T9SS type A sorting domain-containing protein [Chitinophagales bacterium]
MRKFTLLFLALIFAGKGWAQGLPATPSDSVFAQATVTNQFDVVDEYIYLHNNRSDSVAVSWHLVSADVPAGWDYLLCDNNNCYDLLGNSTTRVSSKFAVGDSINMHGEFEPSCINGTGTMVISVKVVGDTGSINLIYSANLNTTCATAVPAIGADKVKIYPTAVSNSMNIAGLSQANNVKVKVYNMIGNVMLQNDITAPGNIVSVNTSTLPTGVYIVAIDYNGQRIVTRRIEKLN